MNCRKRTSSLKLRDRTSHQDRTSNRRGEVYIWILSLVYIKRQYAPRTEVCSISVVVESAHYLCSFVSDARHSLRTLSLHTRWVQLWGVVLALPLGSALNVDETGIKCTPERYIPQYCPLVIWVRDRVHTWETKLTYAPSDDMIVDYLSEYPMKDRASLWSYKSQTIQVIV